MKKIIKYLFGLLLLPILSQCNLEKIPFAPDDGLNSNIKPGFSYTVQGCSAPYTVVFANSSTGATTYQWSFGNLGTSDNQSPSFVFNASGMYNIKLTAKASDNTSKDTTITINLSGSSTFEVLSYAPSSEVRINNNIIVFPDETYAVCGRASNNKVYVYKCTKTGTKVFDNSFGSNSGLYFPSVMKLSIEGDLIIAGTNNLNGTKQYFIQRISKDGSLKKEKLVSPSVYENDESLALATLSDGKFVLMGRKPTGLVNDPEDMLLLHLDAAFNTKKEQLFNQSYSEIVKGIIPDGTQAVYVFGKFTSASGQKDLVMHKIELSNYSIIDSKNLQNVAPLMDEIYCVTPSKKNGNLVIGGTTSNFVAYLVEMTTAGIRQQDVQYETGYFQWVSATADGGYVAGGTSLTSGFYAVKTDENLNQLYSYAYSSFSLAPECGGIEPTSDGGYISTGRLNNSNSTTTPFIFKHNCELKTK